MSEQQTLEQLVDEGLFHIMRQERPVLVNMISDLLAKGESPAAIEHELIKQFGNGQMVRNVRHVANYLERIG